MQILNLDIDKVKPHPKNARRHSKQNIEIIKKSIEEYGQRTPIVIGQHNHILKGCGTWLAMKELGLKIIAVVQAKNLSENQELAYALMDNKSSDASEFDLEKVSGIIQFLDGEGLDLSATGFHDFELESLLDPDWQSGIPGGGPEPRTENMDILSRWGKLEKQRLLLIEQTNDDEYSVRILKTTQKKVAKRKVI